MASSRKCAIWGCHYWQSRSLVQGLWTILWGQEQNTCEVAFIVIQDKIKIVAIHKLVNETGLRKSSVARPIVVTKEQDHHA
ncbi:protein of unknown function [Candidatus Promineifilum breve]|uniref:Uncharacterized protein n=1 Tax=Candidatus Promineifilum breve TaxID=1806508 RepID=A0A160T1Y1_9CHLR|nr:protein of unknown function [Candidatus Promineifilum breve]